MARHRPGPGPALGRGSRRLAGWLDGDAFVWSPGAPGSRQIRYTIRLDEEGRWFEVGEISSDGETWRQFFEMRLERQR